MYLACLEDCWLAIFYEATPPVFLLRRSESRARRSICLFTREPPIHFPLRRICLPRYLEEIPIRRNYLIRGRGVVCGFD